jgi:hypothetical protein
LDTVEVSFKCYQYYETAVCAAAAVAAAEEDENCDCEKCNLSPLSVLYQIIRMNIFTLTSAVEYLFLSVIS